MSKLKPQRRPRKITKGIVTPKNTIIHYFSPSSKDVKNPEPDSVDNVSSSLEELALNSPQKKRLRSENDNRTTSPKKTPLTSHNFAIPNKNLVSPIRKRASSPSRKSSPRKSARTLFPTAPSPKSPVKRKRPEPGKTCPEKTDPYVEVDMNSNLSHASPKRERSVRGCKRKAAAVSSETNWAKDSSELNTSPTVPEIEPVIYDNCGTIKLIAPGCEQTEMKALMPNEDGLKFFKEIVSVLQTSFTSPEHRLKLRIPMDECPSTAKSVLEAERSEYTESLMAVMRVNGFSDTGLDLTRNFLVHKPYVSWKLLRKILYYTLQFCNEADFNKALNLSFDQLALHPPAACDMREYYLLLLINEEHETSSLEKNEEGLLPYLMEALAEAYRYSSPSKAKRARKQNQKYSEDVGSEMDEDGEEKTEIKSSPKKSKISSPKKGRKKGDKKPEPLLWMMPDDDDVVDLTQSQKEIYNETDFAIQEVDSKNRSPKNRDILFQRQLRLLDYVVKVLEVDFIQWNKKYVLETRQKLVSSNESPLVATLMFDRTIGFSSISARIKELFYFYSNSEPQHRKYFERFIALVAEVMRIFEDDHALIEDKPVFIEYPFIREKCRNFAEELFLNCFGPVQVHMSEALCNDLNAKIRSLKPSWLKLLLANQLLDLSLGAKLAGNLSSVMDVLKAFSFDEDNVMEKKSMKDGSMEVESEPVPRAKTQRTKLRSRKVINKGNPLGETELHLACKRRKVNELKNLLLMPDVDIMVEDNNGWRPIHEAAYSGSVECCQLLYEHLSTFDEKFKLLSCRSNTGSTPLLEAISKNHVPVAQYLLSVGGSFLLKQVNETFHSAFESCKSEEMKAVLLKYSTIPVQKFLSVPSHIWNILFTVVSSYVNTYGTEVCLKYSNLYLSPADFNEISTTNESGLFSFVVNAGYYINDLQIIREVQETIKFLKANNSKVKQLLLLDLLFS